MNHLAKESSPYLRQHADNPVDWYPWGNEALEKAKRDNKPILLSIGYAACHWCHVMAHESFEDKETAALMNELFVNIKVDREERPDLDKIYQTSHYLLTQQAGGWPLTIFLDPDKLIPFFSGTYFPREARYQLPAFKDVLQTLATIYRDRRADIEQQNAQLMAYLQQQQLVGEKTLLTKQPIQEALNILNQQYDPLHGGFSHAPKFPQATKLTFLLKHHSPFAKETLTHMALGGLYDQLGGGFYRYSVDEKWRIPHFEKMLYDNGQLLLLYAEMAKQNPLFTHIAEGTATWAMQSMQATVGGYFSSIDADSEGHEGKFYVWDKKDIEALLTPEEFSVAERYFGLNQAPNFENAWHLYVAKPLSDIANELKIPLTDAEMLLHAAKKKMLVVRAKRMPPMSDDKILTSWNGLMIKGMLLAGVHLHQPQFIASAEKALAFIYQHLWHQGRLFASYHDKIARLPAYLDDYVFLIDALLTSLQIHWRSDYLQFARELADVALKHFEDKTSGGFFFTADDHEKLLYRPKTMMDEAIPSGNGVAVLVLLVLGHLLGETRYLEAAEKTLRAASDMLARFPAEHCSLLMGLQAFLTPPQIIIIRGSEKDMKDWVTKAKTNDNYVFAIPNEATALPEALALKKPQAHTCAYVCQGMQCLAVINDLEHLMASLRQ